MTIRLTSPEAFDKVLEKLRQDPMYDEETNAPFMKYCAPGIRENLANDEYYLDIDWLPKPTDCKIVMVIRYHKRSDIQTDEEYLNAKNEEK